MAFSVGSILHMRNSRNMDTWKHGEMETRDGDTETSKGKRKPAIFLNPFTDCSLCKQKFVVCLFVDGKKGSYPFSNRSNGLNGLVHQCKQIKMINKSTLCLSSISIIVIVFSVNILTTVRRHNCRQRQDLMT